MDVDDREHAAQAGLSRRQALRQIVSIAAVALGAACAPLSAQTPVAGNATVAKAPTGAATPGAAGTSSASPAQPKPGGRLRIGAVGDVPTLDGHVLTTQGFLTYDQVYETLIRYDGQMTPQPILAESWNVSTDLKRYQFSLRKGVTFQDGRPFTSDDVKYNILRVRDPKVPSPLLRAPSNWWTSIDTPDPNTIIITSDQP